MGHMTSRQPLLVQRAGDGQASPGITDLYQQLPAAVFFHRLTAPFDKERLACIIWSSWDRCHTSDHPLKGPRNMARIRRKAT
jgi:hypothetical protein